MRSSLLSATSSDEVCHVFGPVDDNGSALDPFGLAADSGSYHMTAIMTTSHSEYVRDYNHFSPDRYNKTLVEDQRYFYAVFARTIPRSV